MQHPSHQARTRTAPGLSCPRGHAAVKHLPPGRAVTSYATSGDRVRVTVRGELDLVSGNRLRGPLGEALTASTGGLDLDLSGLTFCDCAGLTVLLELRLRALSRGKTVVIQHSSPATDRLLHLLGAQDLFSPPQPHRQDPRPLTPSHA
ncbi:STAS domain-containing protein [Streptomyces collinus]|uniref:STAS domain-containing protein n=1 Tax=Streptomyces collinus TaxID=42684 RepID=UPI0033BE447A